MDLALDTAYRDLRYLILTKPVQYQYYLLFLFGAVVLHMPVLIDLLNAVHLHLHLASLGKTIEQCFDFIKRFVMQNIRDNMNKFDPVKVTAAGNVDKLLIV